MKVKQVKRTKEVILRMSAQEAQELRHIFGRTRYHVHDERPAVAAAYEALKPVTNCGYYYDWKYSIQPVENERA